MQFVNTLNRAINHKCYSKATIVINKEYFFTMEALIESGANLKTTQVLNTMNGGKWQ